MKIRDIIDREQETLSMEVFPPKKDTDFEMVKEAALHIASLKPSFMSVTYGAGGSTKGNIIKLILGIWVYFWKRLRQAVNFLQHRCSLIITFSLTLCTG